jgi:hypothetical protein
MEGTANEILQKSQLSQTDSLSAARLEQRNERLRLCLLLQERTARRGQLWRLIVVEMKPEQRALAAGVCFGKRTRDESS